MPLSIFVIEMPGIDLVMLKFKNNEMTNLK